jgi:hypothetical protein
MNRYYLEEDLDLIKRYFPGAQTVTLRTPFDLTTRQPKPKVQLDRFRDDEPNGHWYGGLLWNR